MATAITGSAQSVPLGGGYALRAPGLQGSADIRVSVAGAPAALRSLGAGATALDEALRAADVSEVREIVLELRPVGGAAAGTLRSARGEPVIELEVPDAGPDHGQLVLSVDDAGAMRWHLPEPDGTAVGPGAVTRGAGGATRFRIPGTLIPPPAGAPEARQRSLLGAVTRRVLKVLVYPLTDPVFGALGDAIASRWEQAKRPYRLRAFTPAAFDAAGAAPLASADVAAMAAAGPVLLFVHGTFSTSHGAFAGLPRAVMAQLHERYGGRVMAFDHPTLSEDPPSNVRWLLSRLPAQPIELDIVCHSRGGLVSRLLSEQPAHFGLDAAHVKVRRIVLAGVPNGGTLLADPDHMVHMIDRLTTVLAMIPDGGAAEFLEALVTAVKVIGRGALKGLDGLACMRPAGDFLSVLNAPGGAAAEYFSVASDYEPADRGLRGLVAGVADNVADQVFGNAANDLVVPMAGVHELDGHAGFPVDAARRLQFGRELGVAHTGLFAQPMLSRSLVEWLS